MTIGRNENCPCGSGKKYKNCCMKKVSMLDAIREEDLMRIQGELFSYAQFAIGDSVEDAMEEFLEDVPEDAEDLLFHLLTIWTMFSLEDEDSEYSLFSEFIAMKKKENMRPALLAQVEKWKQSTPSLSLVKEVQGQDWYVVEDVFTRETKRIKLQDESYEKDTVLFGYLIPFGEYYTYFIFGLDLPPEEGRLFVEETKAIFEESLAPDIREFLSNEYPAMVSALLGALSHDDFELSDLEWGNPHYKRTADLLEKKLMECEAPEALREPGIMLWFLFSKRVEPKVKKPEIFAAAMHYLLEKKFIVFNRLSQTDLAKIYGVSVTTLSKAYRELEDHLAEELAKLDDFEEGLNEYNDIPLFDDNFTLYDDDFEDDEEWEEDEEVGDPFREEKDRTNDPSSHKSMRIL